MPSLMRIVRSVRPVFMSPLKPTMPIAPPYHARGLFSWLSMKRMAQSFGAPVTVTAQAWLRKPSKASMSSRRRPSIWSTVWISREYISIWRRPMTLTEPGTQTRLLSLRSTSEHMVSSDSSFLEFKSFRICSLSAIGSSPRLIVPEIGQVSMRRPETRTNISGEAPTRYSWFPRLMKKE
ncbi:hypothetical protein D9M70_503380 [compost metagenome]